MAFYQEVRLEIFSNSSKNTFYTRKFMVYVLIDPMVLNVFNLNILNMFIIVHEYTYILTYKIITNIIINCIS